MPTIGKVSSIEAQDGATTQAISVSGTSAQSAAITAGSAVVYNPLAVTVFFRRGADPTALADGTDQPIPAGAWARITDIPSGYKLAFINGGTAGTVYLTPGA